MKTLPVIVHPDPASLTATERQLGVVDILGSAVEVTDVIVFLNERHRVEYLACTCGDARVAFADGGRWQTTVVPDRYLRCLPRTAVSL